MKENSIEEDIKRLEEISGYLNYSMWGDDINALRHILSDYKRVLKEISELKEKYDKNTHILQNQLDVANADRVEKDKIIDLMARFIDTELSSEHLSKILKIDVKPLETYRENIKQYFEEKVRKSMNKFKVGQKVEIIRTGKIGKIKEVVDDDFTIFGQSDTCYSVEYNNTNERDWFTVHDIELVKEVLDEKEKEYLNNVIKPFREKVTFIQKGGNRLREFIRIGIKNDSEIALPYFGIDTMYKGMEIYKKYTLSELELED